MTTWAAMEAMSQRVEGIEEWQHNFDGRFLQLSGMVNQMAANETMMRRQGRNEDTLVEVHNLMARFEAHNINNDIYCPDNPNE